MDKQMQTSDSTCIPTETPWNTIILETKNRELFEDFCNRNNIPFKVIEVNQEICSYCIRDGFDTIDVEIYILSLKETPWDEETFEFFHYLRIMQFYGEPMYEYEFFARNTDVFEKLFPQLIKT